MDVLVFVSRVAFFLINTIIDWINGLRSSRWQLEDAMVTAPPAQLSKFSCPVAEIVYSYRFDNELYTGVHQEAFLLTDSLGDFVERFSADRKFLVRVKASDPGVSVMREGDQTLKLQSER